MEIKNNLFYNLKRYIKIYAKLAKFMVMWETEYRASFILELFVEVAYFVVGIIGIRVMFWNIKEIAGWNFYQLLTLYGVYGVLSELIMGVAFIFNLRSLPYKIARGELDIYLLKPINSQFAVSLWRPYFASIPSLIPGIVMIIIGLNLSKVHLTVQTIAVFIPLMISGLILAYSVGMIVSTLSFWFINATPLPNLAQQLIFLAKNPYSVYTGFFKIVFLTILPLAFMVSFPTKALLGEAQIWWVPASVALALVFLKFSNAFWNFGLKHYTSASS